MNLKYVGAKPKVSQHGVQFDQTKPDKYTFMHAAIELLETLNSELKEGQELYLHTIDTREYTHDVLEEKLKYYCPNMEKVLETCEEKTDVLIAKYRKKVEENTHLNYDERTAWLGNIDIMHDYYMQYISNETAYACLLQKLADTLHEKHIAEMTFPLRRNYGLVAGHLILLLKEHKPPYDASLNVLVRDGMTIGRLDMNRSKPLSS